jgi:NADPH:quinone reductase-like Zn-dependent oxidoreductase
MKAFAIDTYKGPLILRDVPEPAAGSDEIVIAIEAASVNPLDLKLRQGALKPILPYDMPLVLGHDLSGTVISVGSAVRRFKVGDQVFACAGNRQIGTFAERIAISERNVALKPATLDMLDAAALPLVSLTAWQVFVEAAQLQSGQKVLIHAGSGGVGTVAIQLAKHLGAYVATTVGPDNMALAKELGADEVVDYRSEAFDQCLSDYDLVLNTQDAEVLERSLRVLKPGGKLISISGPPDPAFARQIGASWLVRQFLRLASLRIRRYCRKRRVDYSFLFMRPDGQQLTEIARLVDSGLIRPVIDQAFAFEETPAAMERVASGHARGKVVVRIADTAPVRRTG